MDFSAQREQFAKDGYAVFERVLEGPLLEMLRAQCTQMIAREDARLDALGKDVDGISHRGKRYFVGECQRALPDLRKMLFSQVMAAGLRLFDVPPDDPELLMAQLGGGHD